ncbi:MAG TPA: hydroxyacylglutathione hydrolase family protein [Pseudobdellovibrionaceae bacterium]|nr:hydroxyacylglutathione hydrolase family protein [Pseudobdellovibrionaceae bacterium]
MHIQTLRCLKDNWTFVVEHGDARVVIDPGEFTQELELRLANKQVQAVLLTHHHHDHIGGVEDLLRAHPETRVFASARDVQRLKFLNQAPLQFDEFKAALGAEIQFQHHAIPGHTQGQVALMFRDASGTPSPLNMFVGDTLFAFGCGRCLEGTPEELFQSLQFIKSRPPETLIYFGHDYEVRNAEFWKTWRDEAGPSLVSDADLSSAQPGRAFARLDFEMQRNPFLKLRDVESFRLWRDRRNHF